MSSISKTSGFERKDYMYSDVIMAESPRIASLLKECKINKKALETLILQLGNGVGEEGMRKFNEYAEKKLITVDKIGVDKYGEDKFYLVINESKQKGGWNEFHIGVSRKGNLRAILKPISDSKIDSYNLRNARDLRSKLGKKYQGPISRLMNDEKGVKVTELGGENLRVLAQQTKLSRQERLAIYKDLMQGIHDLHDLGYAHTDLKTQNVVVRRDDEGKIIGVKIIDLDRLSQIGKPHYSRKGVRYLPYSPARIFGKDGGRADPKDDIWAAMCIICEMEAEMPEEDRLLNPSIISKYIQYQQNLEEELPEKELYPNRSLFDGSRPDNVFNNVVFNMAMIASEKRPSAGRISQFLSVLV